MAKNVLSTVIVGTIAVAPRITLADEPPTLAADRPGFSDSTWDVPWGHVAVETGVGLDGPFEALDDATIALPQARIRVGLPGPLEAIVVAPSLIYDGAASSDELGASDLGLGLKVAFDLAAATAMSAVATVTVPTASDGFGSDDPTGTLGLNFDFGVTDDLTLTAAGFAGVADSAIQLGIGGLAGYALGEFGVYVQAFLTRSAACAVETFGDLRTEAETVTTSLGFGGGVTYMPTRSIQFDLFVDVLPLSDTTVSAADSGVVLADPGNTAGLSAGLGFSFLL